jgi:hypothetical protein
MLYTLVMMVCLTDVPRTCEQREQMVDGMAMNPGTAFMQAQPLVARWIETHPGYFVQRWRVLPGRVMRQAAKIYFFTRSVSATVFDNW